MTPAPTLIFIRHGETDWNVEARLQGQKDIPLNDRGRAQARRNGEVLFETVREIAGFDFVASPLSRAGETMRIVRTALRLPPDSFRIDPDLLEITFGAWEGFTLAELAADGSDAARRREADKWGYVPPNGESYRMLAARVGRWLAASCRGLLLLLLLLGIGPDRIPNLPSPQDRVLIRRDGACTWR